MATARGIFELETDGVSSDSSEQGISREHRPSGIQRQSGRIRDRRAPKSRGESQGPKWTILEQFVFCGHRYQVRRRPLDPPGYDAKLTPREELVVTMAVAGETNKGIAYSLGVAPSTVGVFLFRAAAKMGVKSRSELVSAYARRKQT